ncbi:circularly permuted type 2 ATP-grasp protein [Methylacidimicrobium sp. B4]|uniref:circularly permuted type 2 ATP-grasp protein n=1 Tax=Methylacidimicrobium sp. B4 TaxID=2796139 RepID=UPI001A8E779B|nr:circularly permuted type 2 ATP-grasp protein [Methylacidimicrobium sp. B4]QSR85255.1 circularly permuted type 2 ATP-grasp protein [Methylacidimicrobium sp. B4]
MAAVRQLGPEELARRATALNRLTDLAGPFGDAPRSIYDPLPVLLTASEFSGLEAAVRGRARLLGLVLEDLYGPQSLLRRGQIPPALVLGQGRFLRGLHTRAPLAAPRLSLYAADLIRTPDNRFRLLRDHAGAISGLGHALSLRRLAAGILPELFPAGGLRSLRPAREMLVDHLYREAEGRLVAVLSASTASRPSPEAVDEALLARSLGLLRIEPGDLATRNGGLHMKTLSGLLPIATLIRGISGVDLDPLEQGGRPARGVPGAFGALRAGVLTMWNAPGTALVEAAELLPFLDQLCEPLLGEGPLLLRATEEDRALASQAPFADNQATTAAPIAFRLFAWNDGTEWRVLPGGLGLPLEASGPDTPSPGLKDLWVLESEEDSYIVGPPPVEPPDLGPFLAAAHLPSRLADNLFWLGRSVERLEAACRLLMLALPRLESGTSLPRDIAERTLLIHCLARAGLLSADIAGGAVSGRLLRQTLARGRPIGGLVKEVDRLVNVSSERLSPSMLATVRFALRQAADSLPNEETALPMLLSFAATFAGIAAENMSRDGGWLFLEMGRRLERGETMAESFAILLDAPPERLEPGMALSIELADSVLSYDLRHAGILSPGPVLSMVLADLFNPRSLAFQCAALRACLERLGADDDAETVHQLQREVTNLVGVASGLGEPLREAAAKLRLLSDRMHRRFFALLPEAHALEENEVREPAP